MAMADNRLWDFGYVTDCTKDITKEHRAETRMLRKKFPKKEQWKVIRIYLDQARKLGITLHDYEVKFNVWKWSEFSNIDKIEGDAKPTNCILVDKSGKETQQ